MWFIVRSSSRTPRASLERLILQHVGSSHGYPLLPFALLVTFKLPNPAIATTVTFTFSALSHCSSSLNPFSCDPCSFVFPLSTPFSPPKVLMEEGPSSPHDESQASKTRRSSLWWGASNLVLFFRNSFVSQPFIEYLKLFALISWISF